MRINFDTNSTSYEGRLHNNVILKRAKGRASKDDLLRFNNLVKRMTMVNDGKRYKLVQKQASYIDGRVTFIDLVDRETGEVICSAGFAKNYNKQQKSYKIFDDTIRIITDTLEKIYPKI